MQAKPESEGGLQFRRYALYFVPPAGAGWTRWATAWLGWDMAAGTAVAHPRVSGFDPRQITATPRRYGLHATMKPPFRLADGYDRADLEAACRTLCARHAPVLLDGLALERMGRFLALRPVGDTAALGALAADCVASLDRFRAPPETAELDRRRARRLSPRQEANLVRWGYPYVMDEFRFHITLTGRLDDGGRGAVEAALRADLVSKLPRPFEIGSLALAGEAGDGFFHLVHDYTLTG